VHRPRMSLSKSDAPLRLPGEAPAYEGVTLDRKRMGAEAVTAPYGKRLWKVFPFYSEERRMVTVQSVSGLSARINPRACSHTRLVQCRNAFRFLRMSNLERLAGDIGLNPSGRTEAGDGKGSLPICLECLKIRTTLFAGER